MAGGRTQRFAREESAPAEIDGGRLEAELLQRLEDQAAALAEAKRGMALSESALKAERELRRQQADDLQAERVKVQQLTRRMDEGKRAAEQVIALEDELSREKTRAWGLSIRLEEAQAEKQDQDRPRGVLRRKRA